MKAAADTQAPLLKKRVHPLFVVGRVSSTGSLAESKVRPAMVAKAAACVKNAPTILMGARIPFLAVFGIDHCPLLDYHSAVRQRSSTAELWFCKPAVVGSNPTVGFFN